MRKRRQVRNPKLIRLPPTIYYDFPISATRINGFLLRLFLVGSRRTSEPKIENYICHKHTSVLNVLASHCGLMLQLLSSVHVYKMIQRTHLRHPRRRMVPILVTIEEPVSLRLRHREVKTFDHFGTT